MLKENNANVWTRSVRGQIGDREAQHGPFCWSGRIGQGDEHLQCG